MPTMSITAIVLVLLSFVVTFTAARYLGRGFRKRRAEKAEAEARKGQSRQVRRAQDRSRARR
jgi:flagellar biosynthesis/type III secretory pathway M-ring protein FliF/YscJ